MSDAQTAAASVLDPGTAAHPPGTTTRSERTGRDRVQRRRERCTQCRGRGTVQVRVVRPDGSLLFNGRHDDPGYVTIATQCGCTVEGHGTQRGPVRPLPARGKHGARGRTPKGRKSKPLPPRPGRRVGVSRSLGRAS